MTKVIGDAPEEYDSLGEIHDYIKTHVEEATTRDENIKTNAENIEALEEKVNNIDPTAGG